MEAGIFSLSKKSFLSMFWVLRTLRWKVQQLWTASEVRKVSAWERALPLHSRDPFKKGSILNL